MEKELKNQNEAVVAFTLSDAAFEDEGCKLTMEEVLSSGCQDYADRDIRYDSAFKDAKARIKKEFFSEAADLWEDYITMKELGYTLSDIAKKHHVSTECAKDRIGKINTFLEIYLSEL